jgi:hypothetical protein
MGNCCPDEKLPHKTLLELLEWLLLQGSSNVDLTHICFDQCHDAKRAGCCILCTQQVLPLVTSCHVLPDAGVLMGTRLPVVVMVLGSGDGASRLC